MKKKKTFVILLSIVVIIFMLIILTEVFGIYLFERKSYVDLNSGDVKVERYICSLKIISTTHPTLFSREVRRLGIDIPNERIWKFQSGSASTFMIARSHSDGYYRSGQLRLFLLGLELNNISGNERISAIKEALDCWKKVKRIEIEEAFQDIINKYKESSLE